jgi:RNA polymerase sigma-70 factor (ECF subfamily)
VPLTSARVSDFADFYAASYESICVQLYAHTGEMAEAQDVVQEAFCRAFDRWQTLSAYDDPVAWVRKVAWNLATSRWRRMRTAMAFARRHREEWVSEPDPVRLDLMKALAQLPAQQRQAVVLHYLGGLSLQEIATLMAAPVGTVKTWLHRARTKLDALLEVRDA